MGFHSSNPWNWISIINLTILVGHGRFFTTFGDENTQKKWLNITEGDFPEIYCDSVAISRYILQFSWLAGNSSVYQLSHQPPWLGHHDVSATFEEAGCRLSSRISQEYKVSPPELGFMLVVGTPTPVKNHGVKVSWDDDIPNCFWRNSKHVPNHQPVSICNIYIYHISHQISLLWLAINPIYYGKIKVMFHLCFPFRNIFHVNPR